MDSNTYEKKQRYVDLLTNGGFKAFFGDERNKSEVMTLVNALLPEHSKMTEIEYRPTEHQGPVLGQSKEFQFDFMCRDITGAAFIVELQCYHEKSWFKRCVSYAGRAYDRQNRSGLDYDVPPVYLIGLMGVGIDHPDKEYWKDRYLSEYTFREKTCSDLLDETIVIIFAELTKFHKREEECVSDLDRILYILKNSGRMDAPPGWVGDNPCRSILDACEIAGFEKDKREKYDNDMIDEKRLRGIKAAAEEEGFAKGEASGIAKGRAEGEAEGLAKGKAEGKIETQSEVAKKMLSAGMPVEQIMQFTGLDRETIEKMEY